MGFMLVYDITNAKSFDNIAKWLRNIDEHANEVNPWHLHLKRYKQKLRVEFYCRCSHKPYKTKKCFCNISSSFTGYAHYNIF